MKTAGRAALGLLGVLLLLVFGVAPYYLTGLVAVRRNQYHDRENQGLTPASFGLAHEDVAFEAADGTTLKGWWVPAREARGSVVLVHGLNRSRIEMVRKLPFLHGQGMSALLFDLRHHGESGGDRCTFGHLERTDVQAAVALSRRRVAGPSVVWGVSLGAASAMLAASDDPAVAGVVCDSTYRSLSDTVHHHLRLLGGSRAWLRVLPAGLLAEEMLFWVGRRGGFDPAAVDVARAASRLSGRPALFVCNAGDRRMPMEIAFELGRAAGPASRVLVVPGDTHGGAYREGTAAYESAVAALLDEVRKTSGNPGGTT
jgi:pimeloyl-ACP methyl ester carboxylesterase